MRTNIQGAQKAGGNRGVLCSAAIPVQVKPQPVGTVHCASSSASYSFLACPSEGCIAPRLGYGAALGRRSRTDSAAPCAIPSLCSLAIGVAQSRGSTHTHQHPPPRIALHCTITTKKEPECGRVHEGLGLKREGKTGKGERGGKQNKPKQKNEVSQSAELRPDPTPGQLLPRWLRVLLCSVLAQGWL